MRRWYRRIAFMFAALVLGICLTRNQQPVPAQDPVKKAAALPGDARPGTKLVPRTTFTGPALEFDFPSLRIGVAEYEEGPTGATVFYFPNRVFAAVDVRGGAPGTLLTDNLRVGYGEREAPWVDAICFAGGSCYGLEAASGVMAELLARRDFSMCDCGRTTGDFTGGRTTWKSDARNRGSEMNWFPQIGSGSVAQFPLQRKRQWRAITNVMESGELISLPDVNGGQIEWKLSYQELTDFEVANLTSLFATSGGEAGSFGFVDPFANLLGWSEDLSQPGWELGELTATGGLSDPVGTMRAWNLQNANGAEQMLSQSLGVPGEYTICFSAYVWSAAAGSIGMLRDGTRVNVTIGPQWQRVQISGPGAGGATASTFSLAVGAASSIRVFGLQVEAQPWPSPYRPTGAAAGILEETRFSGGELAVVNTAPGLSACQVSLVSRI